MIGARILEQVLRTLSTNAAAEGRPVTGAMMMASVGVDADSATRAAVAFGRSVDDVGLSPVEHASLCVLIGIEIGVRAARLEQATLRAERAPMSRRTATKRRRH